MSRYGRERGTADGGSVASTDRAGGAPGRRTLTDGLQRKARPGGEQAAGGEAAVQSALESRGAGAPLPASVRSGVENATGGDLSSARVHQNSAAEAAADAVSARAFTFGSDIFMGAGESASDVQLMAHEATHVVQQAGGGGSVARQVRSGTGSPTAAEQHADEVAGYVARGVAADTVDPESPPGAFPLPATETPARRHAAAEARFQLIKTSISNEDGTPAGRSTDAPKDDHTTNRMTVSSQLAAQFPNAESDATTACIASARATRGTDTAAAATAVTTFEQKVRCFEDAYRSTYLASTDGTFTGTWKPETWRDKLDHSSKSVAKKLRSWMDGGGYVKFAIPAALPNDVRVGDNSKMHVDIAGGPVLTAGILTFDTSKSPITFAQVENVSGGFRPGPLRHALVLERLVALGYVHADFAGTTVHHSGDGSYAHSHIDRR